MIVLVLHKVRPGFRGKLTRWLIQPQTNVYIGHPSARIRDRLWQMIKEEVDTKGGSAILIFPDVGEQGCRIMTAGDPPRIMRDFDGLLLPKTKVKS